MEKYLKAIIMIVVLMVFASCGQAEKTAKSNEEVVAGLRDCTVMIYSGEVHGSGVVIDNNESYVTIFTVSHVIGDNDQGIITFNSGKAAFANVIYKDMDSDICILRISQEDFADSYGSSIAVAENGADIVDKLNQNDKVFLVGSAVNVAVNATIGEIGSTNYYVPELDMNMIYLYADAMPGMSGSGCYTGDGRLIGILAEGSDNSEVLCIRINDYINVLETLK